MHVSPCPGDGILRSVFICMHVCGFDMPCACWCLQRPEEGTRSSRAGVRGSLWGLGTSVKSQRMFLTAESSLQVLIDFLKSMCQIFISYYIRSIVFLDNCALSDLGIYHFDLKSKGVE